MSLPSKPLLLVGAACTGWLLLVPPAHAKCYPPQQPTTALQAVQGVFNLCPDPNDPPPPPPPPPCGPPSPVDLVARAIGIPRDSESYCYPPQDPLPPPPGY